jgi:hypothetical protein
MGMKDSAKGLAARLRLDSHHAIERFGVLTAAVAVSCVLIFGGASASSFANQQANLDATTLYTPSFTTSKTQVSGDVAGVYVNSHRTRAMVLMHFKDSSSMSADASKYKAYLTGSGRDLVDQPLQSAVTGQIVAFGSTGYMAMVLDSDKPFQQQILNLTMRSNSELVYKPTETRKVREDLQGQKTFAEFDQWRLYFNPGASGAKKTTVLDGDDFDPGAVYAALVIRPDEKKARSDLDTQLAQLQVDQARIAEYTTDMARVNVDGVFITPPAVPKQIAGDIVDGKPGVGKTPSTLRLKPQWVSPRGYEFDWRSGNVETGYLDSIVPEGESYVTFLADKAETSTNGDDGQLQPGDIEWKLTNGRLLSDYGTTDKTMQPLFEIRNNLAQAYQDYYKHKVDYQTKAYSELIDLEVDLRNVRAAASVNDNAKALFTY